MARDPLLDRDDRDRRGDPNAAFLGDASQGGTGNHAGPLLALHRLVRWIASRRSPRG